MAQTGQTTSRMRNTARVDRNVQARMGTGTRFYQASVLVECKHIARTTKCAVSRVMDTAVDAWADDRVLQLQE